MLAGADCGRRVRDERAVPGPGLPHHAAQVHQREGVLLSRVLCGPRWAEAPRGGVQEPGADARVGGGHAGALRQGAPHLDVPRALLHPQHGPARPPLRGQGHDPRGPDHPRGDAGDHKRDLRPVRAPLYEQLRRAPHPRAHPPGARGQRAPGAVQGGGHARHHRPDGQAGGGEDALLTAGGRASGDFVQNHGRPEGVQKHVRDAAARAQQARLPGQPQAATALHARAHQVRGTARGGQGSDRGREERDHVRSHVARGQRDADPAVSEHVHAPQHAR
mmetsp:Transcript_66247/g.209440  ORF Transcript_66247/g.209440 Transcript_66247/m.209440 type:complete len:276 (-) Transcript_66247:505-1332(-)